MDTQRIDPFDDLLLILWLIAIVVGYVFIP